MPHGTPDGIIITLGCKTSKTNPSYLMCVQHTSRLTALIRNIKEKRISRDEGTGRRLKDHRSQHYVRVLDVVAFSGVPSSSTPNAGKGKTMDTTCRQEKSVHRWTAAESSPEPFLCSHPTTSNCPPIHSSPPKLSRLETYTQAQDLQPPPFSARERAHAMDCIPGSIVVETTTGFDSLHIHQTTSIGKCLLG